ncbi:hypothetical protein SLNWT_0773 [Streptomyces albus]|uniref:PDZ domain-containing protein n=1 Tax=Streptomyces albus (strain ATCC 21838 / DSM 41398 / FERM P-419 / JCM 4703 / NBRC 107858) TaxID=1081613 RepID=A0A0B5EI65_STRA4|nr:hypothetical protein SLNWT_0773 [Streptomyces albus]AOU75463.1 hypothetical protein SLNHY_0772 [Streptomyces albus]
MEQTALRPKPMPGRETPGEKTRGRGPGARGRVPGGAPGPTGGRRPGAVRRRRRRLLTLLAGLVVAAGLVLSGVGLGTVSATVIGMSKLADMQKSGGGPGGAPQAPGAVAPGEAKGGEKGAAAPGREPGAEAGEEGAKGKAGEGSSTGGGRGKEPATLGIEAVDAPDGRGALLVGVHLPGPGYTAGLVRGDTLIRFGDQRIRSAGDLARAVTRAQPGKRVPLTVRHENGTEQQLSAVPGVMT